MYPSWPVVSGSVFAATLLRALNQMYSALRQNVTFSTFIKRIYYIPAKVSSHGDPIASPKWVKLSLAGQPRVARFQ